MYDERTPYMKTLSGIYAHPDDETFSGGGTYARYAAAGVRCTIYCATDGDAGKTSGLAVSSKQEVRLYLNGRLAASSPASGHLPAIRQADVVTDLS